MKQVTNGKPKSPKTKKPRAPFKPRKPKNQEYGTSKLEERFAHDFLDKLGVEYVYQYKAEDIGRYYDFACPQQNILIEVDGDYYHAYGLEYEQMNPMQKRNHRVDEAKNKWAAMHCIPLIRIWEHDINDHPQEVMDYLKKRIGECTKKQLLQEQKNKRQHNKLNDGRTNTE